MLSKNDNLLVGVASLKTDTSVDPDVAHLFRGSICHMFPNNALLHNHDVNGKEIYRYPVVQYKIVYGVPTLVAIGEEAIDLVEMIAQKIEQIRIGRKKYQVVEVDFYVTEQKFGVSATSQKYLFISPTILLNQDNYKKYKKLQSAKLNDFVATNITNQIIGLSKRLNYSVGKRITATHNLDHCPIVLKGKNLLGFHGHFSMNFYIPNLLSVGKGVSRGYGCCIQVGN